jgi:hypothetical protein
MKIGKIRFARKLSAAGAVAYLKSLNRDSEERYGFRGTEADEGQIAGIVERWGEFILCYIPHTYLRNLSAGNKKRIDAIKQYISDEKAIGSIQPIIVEGTSARRLLLLDGHTRAKVSFDLGRPILGYIPIKLIKKLTGVKPIPEKYSLKKLFGGL